MNKLTREQVSEIKKLYQEGKKLVELSKMFKITCNSVIYHISEEYRNRLRKYNREYYRKMSPKQKKEYFEKKKEYQRNYHKNRYANDSSFRNKHLKAVKSKK